MKIICYTIRIYIYCVEFSSYVEVSVFCFYFFLFIYSFFLVEVSGVFHTSEAKRQCVFTSKPL